MSNKTVTTICIVFALVISSICVIHTIVTRPLADFLSILKYIAPATIFLFLSNYSAVVGYDETGKTTRYYPSAREALEGALMGALFLIPVGIVILSLYSSVVDSVSWMQAPNFNANLANAISLFVVSISGYILFLVRKRYRSMYGATEILVGLAIAANNAQSLYKKGDFDLTLILAFITAGVYLVVRGLDNFYEGRKEK